MKNKYYGLTSKPNNEVKDNAPDWMNDFLEKQASGDNNTKKSGNPFDGIKDPILNPKNTGIARIAKTCESCGSILAPNEVGVCKNCN